MPRRFLGGSAHATAAAAGIGAGRPSVVCLIFLSIAMTAQTLVAGSAEEAVIHAQGTVQINKPPALVESSYGVDVSWPMHHDAVAADRLNPFGAQERQFAYKEYMQGCIGEDDDNDETGDYPKNFLKECRRWESDRIAMNLKQPAISQNYTHAGFAKVETPLIVDQLLRRVWSQYERNLYAKRLELWEHGNTYLNHWQSPTYMVDILEILSESDKRRVVQAVQSTLEAWTQQPLVLTSLYGIRIYGPDAILAPHVDRLPLVSSAIINVAQDVDEPWPLEVIGHDGKATNITMEPGDMVLYESHSVIHGRPFPLKGKYYANVFLHFEPIGHVHRHVQNLPDKISAKEAYEHALARQQERAAKMREASKISDEVTVKSADEWSDHAPTPGALPAYVPFDKKGRWRQQFEYEKEMQVTPKPTRATLGHVNPHFAAADGMLDMLKEIAASDRSLLFKSDHNGWRPLHEAARGGHADVVEYLLKEGAQVNERPNHGDGGSPLWWAERQPNENAKTIAVLKMYGGVSLEPLPLGSAAKKKGETADPKPKSSEAKKASFTI